MLAGLGQRQMRTSRLTSQLKIRGPGPILADKDNEIPAMFVLPDNLKGPNWPNLLYEKLQQETSRLHDLSHYKVL